MKNAFYFILNPADTDVFKTSSGPDQTGLSRRLEKDLGFITSWRRRIYDVLKKSNLGRLENVWFTTSWRPLIYVVLQTPNLQRLEGVWFMTPWRRL